MESSKVSDLCKKYVDLMSDFYDKYHELKNKYNLVEKERDEYKEKYDKLCKDLIDINLHSQMG